MKVTLGKVLDHVQTQMKHGGLSAALRELERIHEKMLPPRQPFKQLIIELARRVQSSDPKGAMALLDRVLAESPEDVAANVLAASLFDRLGDQKQAKETSKRVLHAPDATPEQQLIAANLLVRLDDDCAGEKIA